MAFAKNRITPFTMNLGAFTKLRVMHEGCYSVYDFTWSVEIVSNLCIRSKCCRQDTWQFWNILPTIQTSLQCVFNFKYFIYKVMQSHLFKYIYRFISIYVKKNELLKHIMDAWAHSRIFQGRYLEAECMIEHWHIKTMIYQK